MKISKQYIKDLVFPRKEGLENKWWHRLIKVLFVFSLIAVFAFSFIYSLEEITVSRNKINLINLREFTKNDNQQLDNTIPSFLEQNGDLGCLNGDTINYISSYDLENNSYCNKDIINNVDKVIAVIAKEKKLSYPSDSTVEEFKNRMITEKDAALQKGEEKRYCGISESIGCTSNNIIKYNKNIFYYSEAFVYSSIITILCYMILTILYCKVFIYIIYGNKNKI